MLFGFLSSDVRQTPSVLGEMAAVLRVTAEEQATLFNISGLGIGILERPVGMPYAAEPAEAPDGSSLWMSGEAFDWPSHGGIRTAADSRTPAFRRRLLDAITSQGPEVISDLDGEYQIALWNPHTRSLLLLNDRFGALPLYTGVSSRGTAFAGGVRGVLMAPGIDSEPDVQAIREAVSFGGYRLGNRTNVRSVTMIPPATATMLTEDRVTQRRYWTWRQLHDGDADDRVLLEEARLGWPAAIARRLDGSERPGLTLSGGLDSRAILAEASQQRPMVAALTYGVPHADDVTLARRAAHAAGAQWELFPLYQESWLERRTSHILATDGLIDLVDLMHTEALERMPAVFDLYLSGYIGDVVAGSTWYFGDDDPGRLLAALPYYGGALAIPYEEALATAAELIASTSGAPRFALFEHKAPQSTNRVTAAARPYVTVRRPFVDYSFFETCQRMSARSRARHGWRERWLLSSYPKLFARIPNQQSGVPAGSSRARWHVTRAARFGWRRMLRSARSIGLPVVIRDRTYHPDERYWSQPEQRSQIERTIMRPDSISCEVFGRSRIETTLRSFFEQAASPVQVIGALYVFERYHQTLSAALEAARRTTRAYAC